MASPFGFSTTALEVAEANKANIEGKVFVVTGAYSGIGLEATKALLKAGGHVVLTGRSESQLKQTVESLIAKKEGEEDGGGGFDAAKIDGGCTVDLADLDSVKAFAAYVLGRYDKVVLVLNAGVMATPPGVTKQGFEQQFGINVIGHFLLAKLLVDKTSRQVWLSSSAHRAADGPRVNLDAVKSFTLDDTSGYNSWLAYQQSKLGDILLAKEFHRRYPAVEAASLHPGVIATNLSRHLTFMDYVRFFTVSFPRSIVAEGRLNFFKTAEQGASTTMVVATTSDLVNGAYYRNCQVDDPTEAAKNDDDAKALFDYCDEVTKSYQ